MQDDMEKLRSEHENEMKLKQGEIEKLIESTAIEHVNSQSNDSVQCDLRAQISDLEQKLKSQDSMVQALNRKNLEVQQQCGNELQRLQNEVEKKNNDIEEMHEKLSVMMVEKEELRKALKMKESECESMEKKLKINERQKSKSKEMKVCKEANDETKKRVKKEIEALKAHFMPEAKDIDSMKKKAKTKKSGRRRRVSLYKR